MNKYVKIMGVMTPIFVVDQLCVYNIRLRQRSQSIETKYRSGTLMTFLIRKRVIHLRLVKNKDKMCIFGVGTAVSPDLQLAIEKGMMIAKSELADIIKGEMNKSSKIFITELGKQHNKTTVSEVESTIVNLITKTPVRGYEIFAKDITMTKNGYYRVWIGLRLPMGDYNKMYNFTIAEAVDRLQCKIKSSDCV